MKVVIYVIDCLRADHVSCYGYHRRTTPNMDALAQDGVLFEKAFSPSTWTKPVAASLLTGLYPPVHRMRTRTDVLRWDLRTLPALLGEHGYTTLAISTIGNVSSSLGYGKGFDHFINLYKEPALFSKRQAANVRREKLYHERQGEVVFPLAEDINAALFDWLEKHLDENLFLFLWAMDPHDPYAPPDDWRVYVDTQYRGRMDGSREMAKQAKQPEDLQHLVDLYDGEIAYTDHCLGELLAYLKRQGIYDETAIFVLGDHGEAFGDHGHMLHGHLPFEEIIRVPLIVKLPGQSSAGWSVPGLVSLLDVMPSILDLAGVPRRDWASFVQGRSLLDALGHASASGTHRIVFSETRAAQANNAVYSARTDEWKYIWVQPPEKTTRIRSLSRALTDLEVLKEVLSAPLFYLRRQVSVSREHVYHLADDPAEAENLANQVPHQVGEYKEAISGWLAECERLAEAYQELAVEPEVDEATLAHLRALGYID